MKHIIHSPERGTSPAHSSRPFPSPLQRAERALIRADEALLYAVRVCHWQPGIDSSQALADAQRSHRATLLRAHKLLQERGR